ncbi:hypothetical protein FB562_2131 [Homoserinimonas aerilata]|uniref:Uncharacterized protein n=1 Tax=Homoserinimonas aerilata TaxID=1162970 RepID=A0A542YEU6_9MICO|nr:hypothetical protein [Homoserinimonas aerilata]TQL46607.1 hypothetical protein FB562_2131 [Homoserinimonas aerilata]
MPHDAAALTATSFEAWSEALDALEQELALADELGEPDDLGELSGNDWVAPTGLGSLPPELVDRARAILDAQRATVARLEERRRDTARHLAALQTVPHMQQREAAVYLDVAG